MSSDSPAIVITGGAQRLGRAVALALNEDGYNVIVTYRTDRPELAQLREQGIETLHANFSDHESIYALCDKLNREHDQLRAIIHNASEWLSEQTENDYGEMLERMLTVHVAAPYLINQHCGDLLQRYGEHNGQSDIIHLTDFVAGTGSAKHIAYAASKAALENLTLSFATKLAPRVKVNSIAPALLMFNSEDGPEYREKSLKKSLLRIAPGESEGVEAVRYLLHSRFLTGKIIALDGGRHLARAS
ncbi:MAG: dihydromonapterin reductase [Pseudomonadota bacterium]